MTVLYKVSFDNKEERDVIRRWVGKTSGATILKGDTDWQVDNRSQSTDFNMVWIECYIIALKSKKAEMLIRLQFPHCYRC